MRSLARRPLGPGCLGSENSTSRAWLAPASWAPAFDWEIPGAWICNPRFLGLDRREELQHGEFYNSILHIVSPPASTGPGAGVRRDGFFGGAENAACCVVWWPGPGSAGQVVGTEGRRRATGSRRPMRLESAGEAPGALSEGPVFCPTYARSCLSGLGWNSLPLVGTIYSPPSPFH